MRIPWTLQRYIFWEMGRTFLLAVLGLSGLLGLGGGILNMIKLGEVTPVQLVRLIALVLPLSAALTLPIAALFAATSTYGRLSADNEFVACRASGINLHVLFLPTLALSVLASLASFGLTNYLIPGMVRNLNTFVSSDITSLIRNQLSRPQGFKFTSKYQIYAGETSVDQIDKERIVLGRVAFVELDQDEWTRFGTAREVHLRLHQNLEGIHIAGQMVGLSCYDRKQDLFYEETFQSIPENQVPVLVPQKIKFLNLPELLHYRSHPTEWVGVRTAVSRLRLAVGARRIYEQLHKDWHGDHTLILADTNGRYTIHADSCGLADHEIAFGNVEIEEHYKRLNRKIRARRAVLHAERGQQASDTYLTLKLYEVHLSDGDTSLDKPTANLGPIAIDTKQLDAVQSMTTDELLKAADTSSEGVLRERRSEVLAERGTTLRKIAGAIHERTAFSTSMLVLVVLGAVLGIVFRGSHVMTAFGISFVPALLVIVTIMTGKQMANNVGTHLVGLAIMWSGIVVVLLLDTWTLLRVLRR